MTGLISVLNGPLLGIPSTLQSMPATIAGLVLALVPAAASGLPLSLARLVLWFCLYSTCGWVYETVYCSLVERRPVRRGFLYGPWCPLYGAGAVGVLLTLGWVTDPLPLFVLGALLATCLEYVTGWALETLFHQRWWDYTGRRGNVRGRICPAGTLAFGGFSVGLVLVVQPMVEGVVARAMPPLVQVLVGGALAAAMMVDALCSIRREKPEASIRGGLDHLREGVPDVRAMAQVRLATVERTFDRLMGPRR
jgi:hypothetical protein